MGSLSLPIDSGVLKILSGLRRPGGACRESPARTDNLVVGDLALAMARPSKTPPVDTPREHRVANAEAEPRTAQSC